MFDYQSRHWCREEKVQIIRGMSCLALRKCTPPHRRPRHSSPPTSTGEGIFSAKKCVLYSKWEAQLIGASDHRQPIPVCLKHKDLKGELEHAMHPTHMHQTRGTCMCAFTLFSCFLGQTNDPLSSVKFGTPSQTPAKVLANLETVLPAVFTASRGGWDNMKSSAPSLRKALLYQFGRVTWYQRGGALAWLHP